MSKKLILTWLTALTIVYLIGWTYTYDTDTPLGSDAPSVLDDRIREAKDAVQERQNIDHYWPLTGSQVSDADAGKHRKVTFLDLAAIGDTTPPTQQSGEAHLFMVSDELWWQDDTNTKIKLTDGGYIEYQSVTDVNNNTYIKAVDAAGTGTVDLIKANADDVPEITVGAVLSAETAPDSNAAIANKKYVDDQVNLSAYTNLDSENNAMVIAHAYKAATAGFVYAHSQDGAVGNVLIGYVGTTDDPAGAGTLIQPIHRSSLNYDICVSIAVAKNEYFEITSSASDVVILWKSHGTLSKPVDQD